MTVPRSTQVSLENTPYYHCIARCVRRAFLCGEDHYSGKNFDHRRQWILNRLRQQAKAFCIDVCAYAIMGNHYHLVLRVDAGRSASWSDRDVLKHWCRLYRGPILVQRFLSGSSLSEAEIETVRDIAAVYRARLTSISWYMANLNEYLARKANAEDQCTGRFWEGRFKSRALLDDTAVLSCMAYVDLNPVRAEIADTLQSSDFTSIKERLQKHAIKPKNKPSWLLSFAENDRTTDYTNCLPLSFDAYLEVLEWTARAALPGKSEATELQSPHALALICLDKHQWLEMSLNMHKYATSAIGSISALARFSDSRGQRWISKQRYLNSVYSGETIIKFKPRDKY